VLKDAASLAVEVEGARPFGTCAIEWNAAQKQQNRNSNKLEFKVSRKKKEPGSVSTGKQGVGFVRINIV